MAKQSRGIEENSTTTIGARVDLKFKKALIEIAKQDKRRLSNMIDVLLHEAVAARQSEK